MKSKVILSIVMVGLLALSIGLAGFGEARAAAKLEPYEIIMYVIGTPQKDLDLVSAELSKYLKEKINTTIKLRQFDWGDEYNQKMQNIIDSGQPFDICFVASWAANFLRNAHNGAFLPLENLIEKYGQEMKAVIHPLFLEGIRMKGHIYAIPNNKELGKQSVWRFNKKYVDKYNIDITKIKTLEDLEPYLKLIKKNESGVIPISADRTFNPYLPFDIIGESRTPYGVYLDTKDYKVINKFEAPETKETLKKMRQFYKAGYIRADVATTIKGDDEKTGKWFVGKCDTQPLADIMWSQTLGYPVVSTPIHEPIVYNESITGSMFAVSVTSQNPERAVMFLNLLNTDPKVRNMIDHGIEGRHYKLVGDGVIELLPEHRDYDMPSFALGNLFLIYRYQQDPPDKWEQFKKFNAQSKKAPTLGFVFDPSPVQTEYAAVCNVADEFNAMLYTGAVDPNVYLQKASKKLKAAGGDKVMAEMQRQIDKWRAENSK
jgi:putative aldouronate transport system substrate-binding protein